MFEKINEKRENFKNGELERENKKIWEEKGLSHIRDIIANNNQKHDENRERLESDGEKRSAEEYSLELDKITHIDFNPIEIGFGEDIKISESEWSSYNDSTNTVNDRGDYIIYGINQKEKAIQVLFHTVYHKEDHEDKYGKEIYTSVSLADIPNIEEYPYIIEEYFEKSFDRQQNDKDTHDIMLRKVIK
jgi:hypothetical protein